MAKVTERQRDLLREMIEEGGIGGFLSRSEMAIAAALGRMGLAERVADVPNGWTATAAAKAFLPFKRRVSPEAPASSKEEADG